MTEGVDSWIARHEANRLSFFGRTNYNGVIHRGWDCEGCGAKIRGIDRRMDRCPLFWNHQDERPKRRLDGSPECGWEGHRLCTTCWVMETFELGFAGFGWGSEPKRPYDRIPRPENAKPQVAVVENTKETYNVYSPGGRLAGERDDREASLVRR